MTQVDFYLLSDPRATAREFFACRLSEKIIGLNQSAYIHTESNDVARYVDDLLWTYQDISFIPHGISGEDQKLVVISHKHRKTMY